METLISDAGGFAAVWARAVDFVAIAAIVGACAFRYFVVRSATLPAATDAARYGLAGALLVIVAACARVVVQAQSFLDPGDPVLPMISTVVSSEWGVKIAVQIGWAVIAAAAFAAAGTKRKRAWANGLAWGIATPAVMFSAFSLTFSSHASVLESWWKTGVGADAVHVLAAGGWAGALGALTWTIVQAGRRSEGPETAAVLIERFRPLALTSATLLVVTGSIGALLQIGTIQALIGSTYGRLLIVKVAVVVIVAALGRQHSLTAAREVRAGTQAAVLRSIGGEALLMVVVLTVTALLSGSPRPGE